MSDFNSPDVSSIKKDSEDLEKKINDLQKIGLPNNPGTAFWLMIQPKLLTPRQVAKKMLMMQNQSFDPPMSEEDAQLYIYGKVYMKNGILFDNDNLDPACVSQPGDVDYQPPITKDHPLWKKITGMTKDLEKSLVQLGIKLGEFTIALPTATVTIAVSLTALASSIVILPFGAGIPTALSAVQTMVSTIKELQSKTAQILPLLGIVDVIGLLLPKDAQAILAQINIIFGVFLTIISTLTAILGLLGSITSKLSKTKKTLDSIPLKVEAKAEPSTISQGQSTKLSVNATGGSWQFKYEWTDSNGNLIAGNPNETDDGTRIITPNIFIVIDPKKPVKTAIFYCKVTDTSTNSVKQLEVIVKRI